MNLFPRLQHSPVTVLPRVACGHEQTFRQQLAVFGVQSRTPEQNFFVGG